MSEWYTIPSAGPTALEDPPAPAALAEGQLRVDRWSVSITAPRFDVTISGPEES